MIFITFKNNGIQYHCAKINKMMKFKSIHIFFLGFFSFTTSLNAQWDYRVEIKPMGLDNLPSLHSYVFAQLEDQYLVIGGRKDGIHPRQPGAAFDEANKNTMAYVIDVKNKQVYFASLSSLQTDIYEQLSSTNMNFHQEGDTLYIIGGYGYSGTAQDHITYPYLTTINVKETIDAIVHQQDVSGFISQIKHDSLAVTGGHLAHHEGTFYLVGGHRFDGRYNPMGHNTYTQQYTHEVRTFTIDNSGTNPVINNYASIHNEDHLRRRDYNLVPQIFEDGEFGFLISSGVFQKDVDLPFLYPVQVRKDKIVAVTDFNQYLSNYHSASVGLYDKQNKRMHSLFFGGLSQYDLENEKLIKDDQVPFVKTISLLTQSENGTYEEFKLGTSMPKLMGGGAEFFINQEIDQIQHEIIDINSFTEDSTTIGYIFGGIESNSANPFTDNTPQETKANSVMYEVRLILDKQSSINYIQKVPGIKVFPNPVKTGKIHIETPFKEEIHRILLLDQTGKVLQDVNQPTKTKDFTYVTEISRDIPSQMLYLHMVSETGQTFKNKVIWMNE